MTEPESGWKLPRLRFFGSGINGKPLPQWSKALIATALLSIFGGIFAPSTVSGGAIESMLPFVAILAVASTGQHIVIRQRGLDLSVAGIISFAGVMVTAYPHQDAGPWETLLYIGLTLLMGGAVGLINGLVVSLLRVPALVTTIGVNSLMLGLTQYVSTGFAQQAPLPLNKFGVGHFLGVPSTIYVMIVFAAVTAFLIARTAIGRRFVAISVNPQAAMVLGVRLDAYRVGTYVLAGICYAAAGVMLAGYLLSPTVFCGLPYMLATIAAVVVGGNSLGGGRGSVVATVIGAYFLTYLGQLVLSVGFGTSAQDVVQAVIVVSSAMLPELARRGRLAYR
jgi:ribose/xylose/arabinose/galactoside ABC-type transport system permease subunit